MYQKINLEKVLFLDIETVSQQPTFNELSPELQKLWSQKSNYIGKLNETPEETYSRAAIYAEFGKIICISVGIVHEENGSRFIRVKTFSGHDEKHVIAQFFDLLNQFYSKEDCQLCAHNGKEFDFPYIARRALINGLSLPNLLNIAGKKPWEVNHLDTLHLWKFGDYKHYTSLSLLATIFNIPTPKDDIDGSRVGEIYWKENNLSRVSRYCEKDVVALTQLFIRFRNEKLIPSKNIVIHHNE